MRYATVCRTPSVIRMIVRGGVAVRPSSAAIIAVSALVEAPATRSDGHSRADGFVDHERAKRAETVPDGVDGDSRDPVRRHRGGDVKAEIFVLGGSVAKNCHWPAGRGLGA